MKIAKLPPAPILSWKSIGIAWILVILCLWQTWLLWTQWSLANIALDERNRIDGGEGGTRPFDGWYLFSSFTTPSFLHPSTCPSTRIVEICSDLPRLPSFPLGQIWQSNRNQLLEILRKSLASSPSPSPASDDHPEASEWAGPMEAALLLAGRAESIGNEGVSFRQDSDFM